ncbi:MAG TPA: hypothetical protein VIV14_11135 [Gammaproteobacteria bacterium]
MKTRRYLSVAIALLFGAAGYATCSADEERPWYGYNVVDEASGRLIYGASKSYIVSLQDGGEREQRLGYQCSNGQPILTIDTGEFLAPSSTDFELHVRIDDLEPMTLDMRIWSNSSSGGFSRIEVIARELFLQMRDGVRMTWRIGSAENAPEGTFSLIGFTAATREFAENCDVMREAPEEPEI